MALGAAPGGAMEVIMSPHRQSTVALHDPRPQMLPEFRITCRSEIPDDGIGRTRDMLTRVIRYSRGSVLDAHAVLQVVPDPHRARPATVEASIDVDGIVVRARAEEVDLHTAIDAVGSRLRRQLDQLAARRDTRHRWVGLATQGEWRHGTHAPTPTYADVPPEERRVLRRKVVDLEPMTVDAAAYEMDLLGHDFYLFRDARTGSDALLRHRPDGTYGLAEVGHAWVTPAQGQLAIDVGPPRLTEEQALERLNAGGEPYVFHVDPRTGRTQVTYRRFDGHYGVITPA